ncbi:formate dehydrogenase subunit delta [Methyloversatilis thermotolerans]|uniref:formate dehydrogenase subunit delta n=1 Tax=Methyloversatilis thermotolerans TaxID=1346290 RepID=UPI00036C4F36|nr:formate dehydrogenase subunit delta [Methyloversatilis thermotolerans]
MDIQNLVKMANQIGQFFQSYPNHEEAVDGVAGHIQRFWEPRMRNAILAHAQSGGETGLLPLVVEALQRVHGTQQAA